MGGGFCRGGLSYIIHVRAPAAEDAQRLVGPLLFLLLLLLLTPWLRQVHLQARQLLHQIKRLRASGVAHAERWGSVAMTHLGCLFFVFFRIIIKFL